MSVGAALACAIKVLTRAGIAGAARDARALMSAALGIDPGRLVLHQGDTLGEAQEARFWSHVRRRIDREPVAQIVGARLFFGHSFVVTADVLDPRPETETLVAEALRHPFEEVLDLGTGSGCILLTLLAERAGATGIGVDRSEAALDVARRNASRLGVAERSAFICSDWFESVAGRFDLIVANPPYIAAAEMSDLDPELSYEPRVALTDEGDGLDAYRAIARAVAQHLTPDGRVLLEIGPTQAEAVTRLLCEAGLGGIGVLCDMDGRDRVVAGGMKFNEI